MSLRNRLVLPIILISLAVLAACGGGTSNPTPPPSGAFSNTNFSGAYTFSVLGANGSGTFAMAGTLTACGCVAGTISGGSVDLVDSLPTVYAAAAIDGSKSTYSISKDGRGFAKLLITPTGGTAFEVDVDFVLTSSTHGLITRFDGNGTGSGTIDSQNLVAQAGLANLPFAYGLSGADLAGDPLSQVGAFTLDASGNIIATGANAGVADTTLYSFSAFTATPYPNSALSGSVVVGSGTAPGPATLTTSLPAFGTLTFDVYEVDSTHLKLIETDGLEILVGDVFTQPTATIPAGNLVFSMAGPDPGGNPFAAAGVMASDGTSKFTSGSEDLNDNGQVDFGSTTPQGFTGTFTATGGGRFLVTLSTFTGGTTFTAYPSSAGLLLQEIDAGAGSGITGGVALAQTNGASIAASQGYGLNFSGADISGLSPLELDEIAEFKTTGSTLTGILDANDGGGLNTSNLSGNYSLGSGGLGSATLSSGFGSMFFYAVDNSTVLLLSTDSLVVGIGAFEVQTAPAQSALELPRIVPMLRPILRPHAGSRTSKAAFVRK
jgi:hypothetical protein